MGDVICVRQPINGSFRSHFAALLYSLVPFHHACWGFDTFYRRYSDDFLVRAIVSVFIRRACFVFCLT